MCGCVYLFADFPQARMSQMKHIYNNPTKDICILYHVQKWTWSQQLPKCTGHNNKGLLFNFNFLQLKKNLFKNVLTFLQSINSAEPSLHSVSKTIRKERHFNRSQKFEPMTTDMLTKPSLNFVSYIKHVLHNWSVHL